MHSTWTTWISASIGYSFFFNTQTPRYGRRTRLHRLKSLADKLINGDTNNCVRTWNQRQQQKTKQQILRLIRKTKTNQRMDEACECDLVRPSATHCFSSIIIIIIKNGTISHTFSEFKLHLDQKKAVCRFVLFFPLSFIPIALAFHERTNWPIEHLFLNTCILSIVIHGIPFNQLARAFFWYVFLLLLFFTYKLL